MIINQEERPITAAIHPKLIDELRDRKELIEKETGRKSKGGLTCFSEMAALELRYIRETGDNIFNEILKIKNLPTKKFKEEGVIREFVPYEIFKKIYIFASILKIKKDAPTIKMEISKIRGLKKNDIKYYW